MYSWYKYNEYSVSTPVISWQKYNRSRKSFICPQTTPSLPELTRTLGMTLLKSQRVNSTLVKPMTLTVALQSAFLKT